MTTITQTVTLKSQCHFGHKVPPGPFGTILREIPAAVGQSIRMAFEGRSSVKGKKPHWLTAAADIRFVGYGGDDDTVMYFEAPRLGEAAEVLYRQQEMPFMTRPSPDDTGFDLLGDVLGDLGAENTDSERFDRPLLRQLRRFSDALSEAFNELQVAGHRFTQRSPATLNRNVIETARRFVSETPLPQRVRVAGNLDMIRASTQAFALKLENGEEVRGVLLGGDIGTLTGMFQQEVLVLGKAIYRASGRLLRIDAEEVSPASEQDRYFSAVPRPVRKTFDLRQVLREQEHKKGLSAIFGKWPGNETDEQIQEALKELS